jgi:hypothetical protein
MGLETYRPVWKAYAGLSSPRKPRSATSETRAIDRAHENIEAVHAPILRANAVHELADAVADLEDASLTASTWSPTSRTGSATSRTHGLLLEDAGVAPLRRAPHVGHDAEVIGREPLRLGPDVLGVAADAVPRRGGPRRGSSP